MANLRELRRTYGFDEVAISPGAITVNPEMVETDFSVGEVTISTNLERSAQKSAMRSLRTLW